MEFSDLIQGENGLLIELRCNNTFNEMIFSEIKNYLLEHLSEWRIKESIPIRDAVALFDLIEHLCGTSRFWSKDTELRVEDAIIEIQEIIHSFEI